MSKAFLLNHGENCITSSINLILNAYGYNSKEYELICCDNFLNISYNSDIMSIYSNIFTIVTKSLQNREMNLFKISTSAIDAYLKNNHLLLLNINIKYLSYFKPPGKEHVSDNCYHFIVISERKGNYFYIYDSFIPTLPTTSFEGWVKIDDSALYDSTIYTLLPNKYKKIEKEYIEEKITLSLKNSVNSQHNYLIFSKFAYDLNTLMHSTDIIDRKSILLNITSEISFGGIKNTRDSLYNFVKDYNLVSRDCILDLSNLNKLYQNLRIFFLKSYVTCEDKHIQSAIDCIKKIQLTEYNIFSSLLDNVY